MLHLTTRADAWDGYKLWGSGDARLDAPDGPVAVQAKALLVFVGDEHVVRHGTAVEVGSDRADPSSHPAALTVLGSR